jgi:hypothetical protein
MNRLISRASGYELLPHAYVKACNLLPMELTDQVIKVNIIVLVFMVLADI